ncbi:MAG TPA: hypothetical protein VHD56_02875 [Tepidisphaeraceae bacterium]|nr:hypothetical protein [Tepidisphaeraceae bacterium]
MNQRIIVTGMSNQEFLDTYALPGRVGLANGTTLIDKAIARAQRHVDADKNWGSWAHAFLFQGVRHDKHHWVIESDLEIHRKHIRLGVQENRLAKFHNEGMYCSLAILDFGLNDEQIACLLSRGLELVAARTRYSLRELVGTLFALRHPSLRSKSNLLSRPQSYYCSAFVHHLFRSSGLDLAPGLDEKHTTPEDLWRTLAPHTAWVLEREKAPSIRGRY